MRKSIEISLPKLKYYNSKIQSEPKKNLQVYIQQSTFKKMMKKVEQGMTLSQITEEALNEYLV